MGKQAAVAAAAPAPTPAPTGKHAKRARAHIVSTGAASGTRSIGDPLTNADSVFPGWTGASLPRRRADLAGKSALSLCAAAYVGAHSPLRLNEHCQKRGFDKANVLARPNKDGQGFTSSVQLRRRNAKDGHVDQVLLRPPPDAASRAYIDRPTATEARHFGAVYALFRFANALNLRMVLAPPLADYWRALEAEKKASPKALDWLWAADPFGAAPSPPAASQPSRSGPPTASSSRAPSEASGSQASTPLPAAGPSRPLSRPWADAPEVRMSPDLRELVEATVRAHVHVLDADLDLGAHKLSAAETKLRDELVATGFRPGHVERALATLSAARASQRPDPVFAALLELGPRDAALEWLQLSVPEVDMPASLTRRKPLDSIARVATSADPDALRRSWAVDRLERASSFPLEAIEQAMEQALDDEGLALDLLVRRLLGWTTVDQDGVWSEMALVASALDDEPVGQATVAARDE